MRLWEYFKNLEWAWYKERRRNRLQQWDVTIIASNCVGTIMYHDLGLPFRTPTINLTVSMRDLVKMAGNLRWYMEQELTECALPGDVDWPAGLLGDIQVNFVHYASFAEAVERWEERKKRINWDRIVLVGAERDEAAAVPWLEKSAQHGNALAKYRLGKLLLLGGETVSKDVQRALELLTECAEEGNQFAQYTLGKAYLLGGDIPRDQEQAVHWLKLSAEQGNQYAKYYLDRAYSSIFSSTASLLYHMGRIFQEQRPQPVGGMRVGVDSKLRRRIREKKIAMGHKPDDHEEEQRMQ